jgi:hypothetical protein
MDFGMIGKIEKAKMYARERNRIHFESFEVKIEGDHRSHTLTYKAEIWQCDCDFFKSRGVCSHTMAMEKVLGEMALMPHSQADLFPIEAKVDMVETELSLEQLLEAVTEDNLHREVDTGLAVGNEAW